MLVLYVALISGLLIDNEHDGCNWHKKCLMIVVVNFVCNTASSKFQFDDIFAYLYAASFPWLHTEGSILHEIQLVCAQLPCDGFLRRCRAF